MKKIKKLLVFVCVLTCVFALTACGNSKDKKASFDYTESDLVSAVTTNTETVAEWEDKTIDDAMDQYDDSNESEAALKKGLEQFKAARKEAGEFVGFYLDKDENPKYTLTEELCKHGIREYAISETQKYGHVTYFWNGNRSEKFDENLETYVEIKSDVVPFEQRPWMKSAEITDELCAAIESGKYDFLRTNYPNGDMVGHTGSLTSTIIGVESVDLGLQRVMESVKKVNGVLLITADHGNADEMYQAPKEGQPLKAKTSHTLNRVPFIVYNAKCKLKTDDNLGLSNIAATVADFLGIEPNEHWNESLLK